MSDRLKVRPCDLNQLTYRMEWAAALGLKKLTRLAVALLVIAPIYGQTDSLRNVNAVRVDISEKMDPNSESADMDRVRTSVELRLRTLGLIVQAETTAPSRFGISYVCMKTVVGYACSVSATLDLLAVTQSTVLSLKQPITSSLPPSYYSKVSAWNSAGIFTSPLGKLSENLVETVSGLLDQFSNAWLAANPKTR